MSQMENGHPELPLWTAEDRTTNTIPTLTDYHALPENQNGFLGNGHADTADRSLFPRTDLFAAQKAEASTGPCALYDTRVVRSTFSRCGEMVT